MLAGGGQATVTWNAEPGVQYWMLYAPQGTPLDMINPPALHVWATYVTSPYVVTGLTDGQVYAFTLNGRVSGGPGGAQTPTVYATPAPAGVNWTAGAALGSNALHGVTYGTASSDSLTHYVAVGDASSLYYGTASVSGTTGLNGVSWTSVSTGPAMDFKAVVYAYGEFIAVGANDVTNNVNIYRSTDMVTWNPAALTGTAVAPLNAVAGYGSTLVAVGNGGAISSTIDGTNWVNANTGVNVNLRGISYIPVSGLWVAVGDGGTVLTSPDLVNWTSRTSNVSSAYALQAITYLPAGALVAVGQGGSVITSLDGITWTAQALPSNAQSTLYTVTADAMQVLAAGAGGVVYTSPVNTASPGLLTWTHQTNASSLDINSVYGAQAFYIGVGQTGSNLTSQ